MESRIEIDRGAPQTLGNQTLDCMWAYVYKLDEHGLSIKFKTRSVIRGDQ